MRILIQNKITPNRYFSIKSKMKRLGAPVIDCIKFSDDEYFALDGSHRITAAKELGLEPIINVITDVDTAGPDDLLQNVIIVAETRRKKNLYIEFEEM